MVGLREFQDCRRRIDAFEHVDGQAAFIELERLGPVSERDQTVDLLVVALLVERESRVMRPCLSTLRQASRAAGSVARMRSAVARSASLIDRGSFARDRWRPR